MVLAEQIKEIEQRREALERCLDIDQKRIDLRNEEEKTQEPNFWDNPDKAREQLRKVAGIKAWVEDYDAIRKDAEDLQLMPDFVKEGVVSEEEMDAHYAATLEKIEKLEMRNMLRRDEDKLGAILDINAGAGGTEALDCGTIGKNLMNMEFPLEQETEGGTQHFLMKLRESKLTDDALVESFYDKIIENYDYPENYYIILIHGVYDIPGKSSDGAEMFDASDEPPSKPTTQAQQTQLLPTP